MDYYDLIKTYGAGKGEKVMWMATKRISDFIEPMKEANKEAYWKMIKSTYADMCGPHYNEEFAMWEIEQMYFKDKNGEIHHSPRWTKAQYKAVYDANRMKLNDQSYNMWDFAVTLEMMAADNHCLYMSWWPEISNDDLDKKFIESAINYLNDDDEKDHGKIWERFNGVA